MRKTSKIAGAVLFFLSSMLMFNCSDDSGSSNDGQIDSSDYVYFMSGKINGEPFVMGQQVNATTVDYTAVLSNTLPAVCAYYPDTGGFSYSPGVHPNFDNEARPAMGVTFVRFHLCADEENQMLTFNDKFPLGLYDFAESGEDSSGPVNHIGLSYTPNALEGPYYSTYGGDQTGSSFEITSSVPANSYILNQLILARQVVEGTFSATFYNTADPSDVIEITDGQFKVIPSTDY